MHSCFKIAATHTARVIAGLLLSISIIILFFSIISEHLIAPLFVLWMIWIPIAFLGSLIVWYYKISYLKTFCAFILLTVVSTLVLEWKNYLLEKQRIELTKIIIPKFSEATKVGQEYFKGDGIDNEAFLREKFLSRNKFEEIVDFYEQELPDNEWMVSFYSPNERKDWENNNSKIGINIRNDGINQKGQTMYSHTMLFWGGWMYDLKYPIDTRHRQ